MNTRSKFHLMARAGYGARGVVFLMVAALALFSGFAGAEPDTNSARPPDARGGAAGLMPWWAGTPRWSTVWISGP